MRSYSLSHLGDRELLRDLAALVTRDRSTTAALLAHLAEVDARKLYLPAAYPSMYAYCVHELHLSEDAAYKRIRAARTARQFPMIFEAVADGRLHLGAVVMLTPYMTMESAEGLLAAATHKTKAEVEQLLAQRFPRTELPARVEAIDSIPIGQLAPGPVESPGPHEQPLSPAVVTATVPRPKVTPLAPQRFALQVTIGQSTHDKLRYAQGLLGHRVPSGDVGEVLDLALDALIERLEKRKFAATNKPRRTQRRATSGNRHIPAGVKRAVWERDGGRCTFVSEAGQRCPARTRLEYDHVAPVARAGRATVENIRLRCRAHNQYGAECTFGRDFMESKRQESRLAARAPVTKAVERVQELDVVPWLRRLGFRADETRRAAALCENIPDASLEERVRVALSYFHTRASSPAQPHEQAGRAACLT